MSGLLAENTGARALTRDLTSAAWPGGIEVVRGDLSAAATLDPALEGVDVVFLLWHQASAENPAAAVEAIARHARRIVYVSSLTVDVELEEQTHPMTVIHADIERLIRRSGLEWTFLRAGRFSTNSLGWAPEIRTGDVVRLPNAAAGRSPIDPRDVAAVAVRALVDDGHASATHILTGPERLTEGEMVRIVGEVIGRTLGVEEVPPETAGRELLDGGASPELADAALRYWAKLVAEPEPVTSTVEEITGSPARTFREWATEHADSFR
jgi:uncharacterized protein YbjT (DUF2867 family)